ncbi:hypothetical protein [Jatrophihabitans fulvus]
MLLGHDEYPFHQVTATFAGVGGSDTSWNDGHYVCVADADGRVALTSNLRLYSNTDVMDGFVCVRHEGRQHNVRVSRRLRPRMEDLVVGPLRLEIVEPLRTVRLVLDENEFGVALDLTCRTNGLPYEDPVEVTRHDGRLVSERLTYEVTGTCEGWVEVDGERVDLIGGRFFRNHSWGYQPGRGGPRTYSAPSGHRRRAPGVRQWVLFDLPRHGGFWFVDPSGRRASGKGALLYPDRVVPVTSVVTDLDFHDGGQRLRGGSVRLTDADGGEHAYTVEDLGWVYCQGGGYFGGFDDGLGQGVYRGEYHAEGEVWDVSHPTKVVDAGGEDFEFEHAWAESFVRLTDADGATGLAHYECVVIS